MIGTGNLKTESTYETLVRWAFFKKFFLTKLPMKSALNVALCFKPLVGGACVGLCVGEPNSAAPKRGRCEEKLPCPKHHWSGAALPPT